MMMQGLCGDSRDGYGEMLARLKKSKSEDLKGKAKRKRKSDGGADGGDGRGVEGGRVDVDDGGSEGGKAESEDDTEGSGGASVPGAALVPDGGVDELGRCFVARLTTIQSLMDRAASDEKDPYMFSLWSKRSDPLQQLQADSTWRTVFPLPKPYDLNSVGTCLSEHLGLEAKRDPTIRQDVLDDAYRALVDHKPIVSHRDVILFSSLRGYFIDLWRTVILTGRNAMTPANMAFMCSALVYMMDSRDPADQDDYKSISHIMRFYTKRSPAPSQFGQHLCAHSGSVLSKIHPLSPAIDATGAAPRLIAWLLKSQRLKDHPAKEQKQAKHEKETTGKEEKEEKEAEGKGAKEGKEAEGKEAGGKGAVGWGEDGVDGYPVWGVTPMQAMSARAHPRWVDVLVMVNLITSVYLQPILDAQSDHLTVDDLLRMTLSTEAHNELQEELMQDWKDAALDHEDPSHPMPCHFLFDATEYPKGKRPKDLWNISNQQLKPIQKMIQKTLVRLIGSEGNRKLIVQWMAQVRPLILNDRSIRSSDRLSLSQFVAFFGAVVSAIKPAKFAHYCASVVVDVIQSLSDNSSYKVCYMPETNKNQSKKYKGENAEDVERRRTLVATLVNVHKWRFKLKHIERAAENANLLPPDPNLTDAERAFKRKHNPSNQLLSERKKAEVAEEAKKAEEAYLREPIVHHVPIARSVEGPPSVATIDVNLLIK